MGDFGIKVTLERMGALDGETGGWGGRGSRGEPTAEDAGVEIGELSVEEEVLPLG